jgi:hypothetical protein
VLEFDKTTQVRIAPLRVREIIERETRNLQHVQASKP